MHRAIFHWKNAKKKITRFVSINLHQAVYHDSPISVNLTNIQSAQNKRSLSIFLIKNEKDKDAL